MTLEQIGLTAVLAILAAALQSAVGFGSGLFMIPLLVWSGVSLPASVSVAMVASGSQQFWSWLHIRGHVSWRDLRALFWLRLVTLPIGVALMVWLAGAGEDRIKQVVGATLLAALIVQWAFKPRPRHRVAAGWTLLAGVTSGILSGWLGMGGPPLVLWVMAHDWSAARARVFLWISALLLQVPLLAVLWWQFGHDVLLAIGVGVLLIPLTLLGSTLGLRLGARMSRTHLRVAAMALLAIIALTSILGPIL